MLSLGLLRTFLPRVMTSSATRYGLTKCGCSAHAHNPTGTVPVPGPVPDLPEPESWTLPRPHPRFARIGDAPLSPSPICRGRRCSPVPGSHQGFWPSATAGGRQNFKSEKVTVQPIRTATTVGALPTCPHHSNPASRDGEPLAFWQPACKADRPAPAAHHSLIPKLTA